MRTTWYWREAEGGRWEGVRGREEGKGRGKGQGGGERARGEVEAGGGRGGRETEIEVVFHSVVTRGGREVACAGGVVVWW